MSTVRIKCEIEENGRRMMYAEDFWDGVRKHLKKLGHKHRELDGMDEGPWYAPI